MKKYDKLTPEGTKDCFYEQCTARTQVKQTLGCLFESRGYNMIMTPGIEFFDVYDRESAGIPSEDMFRFTDRKGRLVVLRADNTLPIARVAGTGLKASSVPMRLYYSQDVYCEHAALSGKLNEKPQCGIELIGASGIRADLEVIMTSVDALESCGITDFKIELGAADFFSAICKVFDFDSDMLTDISSLIESKNFSALSDILDTLPDCPEKTALKSLPRMYGGMQVISQARSMGLSENELIPLEYLGKLYEALRCEGLCDSVAIDLGLVHRSNYYTGMVFRGYIAGSGATVISGGRYDNLTAEFGRELCCAGFGAEVDEIARVLIRHGMINKKRPPDAVIFAADGEESAAMMLVKKLNKEGQICINSTFDSLEQTEEYAASAGILSVISIKDGKISRKKGGTK